MITNAQFGTVRGSAVSANSLAPRHAIYNMSFLAALTSFATTSSVEESPVTSVFEKVFPVAHNEDDEEEEKEEEEEEEDDDDDDEPEDVRYY